MWSQKKSLGKRALPCISCSCSKRTIQLNSVCRQTDRPGHSCLCLKVWIQDLQYSEVHERIFISISISERGLRNGDGQRQLSAELGTCTQARVWKRLHCPTANSPDAAHIHQTRNLQSHTSDCSFHTVYQTKNDTRWSCRKNDRPPPSTQTGSPHLYLMIVCEKYGHRSSEV